MVHFVHKPMTGGNVMKAHTPSSPNHIIDRGQLAIHVLCAMTTHQRKGARCTLDELITELGVRRPDVRDVVSVLHRQGYVDLQRMSLTLAGFAIGMSLRGQQLTTARRQQRAPRAAA
jgi:hypothetical protein